MRTYQDNYRKKVNLILIFFVFASLSAFFIFDAKFYGPDQPIYYAYTFSVVEDQDLNVVNQLNPEYHPYYFPSGEVLVSKTYNFPDYHNHGGVTYWAPFYLFGESLRYLSDKLDISFLSSYDKEEFARLALSLSTLAAGLLAATLTYLFSTSFFPARISFYSSMAIIFGTPFFYFCLFETGNAQILAALLSILSIWFCANALQMKKIHWFLYGLFFSACLIVKIDILFQVIFIGCFFLFLLIKRIIKSKKIIFFLIGLVPGLALNQINSYIKYGTFHLGYLGIFNSKSFYFFQQLFSPYRGFFYTSPIFYLLILGFLFLAKDLWQKSYPTKQGEIGNVFIFSLGLYLFLKIFFLSFRYAWGGGTPGARLLLSEYPVFVLLYAYILQKQKRRWLKIAFYLTSAIFIFWNLLVISEFVAKTDIKNIIDQPSLLERLRISGPVLINLFSVKDLTLKLIYLPVFSLVLLLYLLMLKGQDKLLAFFGPIKQEGQFKSLKLFVLLIVYFYSVYSLVTVFNITNNKLNVNKMKSERVFDKAKIIDKNSFEKFENISSLDEMIQYHKYKDDDKTVEQLKRIKDNLYKN